MNESTTRFIQEISQNFRADFQDKNILLSFGGFLDQLQANPRMLIRNAPSYILDMVEHFGKSDLPDLKHLVRYKVFDLGTEKGVPIIGAERVQNELIKVIRSFVSQGYANKLIMLHGPNGSAKTSMIESVSHGLSEYSRLDEGAVYTFNWVFPTDKGLNPSAGGETGTIGFGVSGNEDRSAGTFAHLDESKIASKIRSEYKDNPVFLIPMPQREQIIRSWLAAKQNIGEDEVEIPPHLLISGLSKKNQLIFENLLSAYEGDLSKVYRHVQVERFFYSRQYRIGVGTVEPQMSVDAVEKQLTMDKNIANLPPILHNISFFEAFGPLVEANRGILEFSDLLKRPMEAYKYLLSTIEKSSINLTSSTANLDIVFVATSNDKHLDAFKTTPDFSSFRSRFELVTAPYLLRPSQEELIYKRDVEVISKSKRIAPHSVRLLATWAVMTRLKHPDPEKYESKIRSYVARLDPRNKVRLYENLSLCPPFKPNEEQLFREFRIAIMEESLGNVVYEGRFGASPRELKALLYKAASNPKYSTITPMAIFEELDLLVKDRTVYEFLQLEPRGKYHAPQEFIRVIKGDFADTFESEVMAAMELVDEKQYDNLLIRYIDHVVAAVKKERIQNELTGSYEQPSEQIMKEIERIIGVSGSIERHREGILGKIAAYRIDNPNAELSVTHIFDGYLQKLQEHYYKEKKAIVDENFKVMLQLEAKDKSHLSAAQITLAEATYLGLESRFGYDPESAKECLKFLLAHKAGRS